MLDKLKKMAESAKEAVSEAAVYVGDLNGDGKVDEEDARIAAEWAKKTASSVGEEATRLGTAVARSDMVKDAAAGAAIGAVVAMPLPVIGPLAGAAIGAGAGVYRNLTKGGQPSAAKPEVDVHAELLKLEDLRQKNIISQIEFDARKKKILEE